MLDGRFNLGVGSGEALNEHILGDHWHETDVRLEMLREAVEVMRTLWEGCLRSHYGHHYAVENARVYDLPGTPPVIVSGFGPKAVRLAADAARLGLFVGVPAGHVGLAHLASCSTSRVVEDHGLLARERRRH